MKKNTLDEERMQRQLEKQRFEEQRQGEQRMAELVVETMRQEAARKRCCGMLSCVVAVCSLPLVIFVFSTLGAMAATQDLGDTLDSHRAALDKIWLSMGQNAEEVNAEEVAEAETDSAPSPVAIAESDEQSIAVSLSLCGEVHGNTVFPPNTVVSLTCTVLVQPGATLVLGAGTEVVAIAGGDSSVVVLPGGRLMAEGTKQHPIIFRSDAPVSSPPAPRASWGNVIICGNAPISTGLAVVGGVSCGGADPKDGSGVLSYVSVRYGGHNNSGGLVLAGVGSGTVLHHVEALYTDGVGVNFIGGTVHAKHLFVSYASREQVAFGSGYQGEVQFVLALVAGEGAVGVAVRADAPSRRTHPILMSLTIIGNSGAGMNQTLVRLHAGAGCTFDGLLLTRGAVGVKRDDCSVEARAGVSLGNYPNYVHFGARNLFDTDVAFALPGACSSPPWPVPRGSPNFTSLDPDLNLLEAGAVGLEAVGMTYGERIYPTSSFLPDSTIERVPYVGAVDPEKDWMLHIQWTGFNSLYTLNPQSKIGTVYLSGEVNTEDLTLYEGTRYILTSQLHVLPGRTLTMMPGVVVEASLHHGAFSPTSAIVIHQGAKIMAEGTRDKPITLTTESKDLPRTGLWGGILIMGGAPVSTEGGIRTMTEKLSYPLNCGGTDPNDSSGVMTYVRIWYAGYKWQASLAMCGVGTGTLLENIDIAWGGDDGVEFYGGTAQLKYLSVTFCVDDSVDADVGFQGKIQYLFVALAEFSETAFEMDSKTNGNLDSQPRSHPVISHATLLGLRNRTSPLMTLREGLGGVFTNMIMYNPQLLMKRRDCASELITQDATLATNYPDYFFFSPNNLLVLRQDEGLDNVTLFDSDDACPTNLSFSLTEKVDEVFVDMPAKLKANDAGLYSFDPRMILAPSDLTAARYDLLTNDPFFEQPELIGAFASRQTWPWINGWTWLGEHLEDTSLATSGSQLNVAVLTFIVLRLTLA